MVHYLRVLSSVDPNTAVKSFIETDLLHLTSGPIGRIVYLVYLCSQFVPDCKILFLVFPFWCFLFGVSFFLIRNWTAKKY